ncbi:MAG: hypothetical protein ACKVX7_17540 [Planctomycetota bacterium]
MSRRGEVSLFEMLKQPQLQKERDSVLAKQIESSNTANDVLLVKAPRSEQKTAQKTVSTPSTRTSPSSSRGGSVVEAPTDRTKPRNRWTDKLAAFWPRSVPEAESAEESESEAPSSEAVAAATTSNRHASSAAKSTADRSAPARRASAERAALAESLESAAAPRSLAALDPTERTPAADGAAARPTMSSWLNQRQEFRHATLVMSGIFIVTALAIAFAAGHVFRTEFEARQAYLQQTYESEAAPWLRDLKVGMYPKAAIREVKSSGATLVNGAEPTADGAKEVAPNQTYIPIATSPPSTGRATSIEALFKHIEVSVGVAAGSLPLASRALDKSRDTDKSDLQLYAGPFETREEAEQMLAKIRKVPTFMGTPFSGLRIEKFPAARKK